MRASSKVIRQFFEKIDYKGLEVVDITYPEKPFEFENTEFNLITRDNGSFLVRVSISKRLIVAYAQNLLRQKNILLLPDFVETSAVLFLIEILNKVEEVYNVGIEISPCHGDTERPTIDLLLQVRYEKVFAPILLSMDRERFFELLLNTDLALEERSDVQVTLSGERYVPLKVIGELKSGDILRLPSEMNLFINDTGKLTSIQIYHREGEMEQIISNVEELAIPLTFKIEVSNITLSKLKEIIREGKVDELISKKECKILIGNSVIATGEINETQVNLTKILI